MMGIVNRRFGSDGIQKSFSQRRLYNTPLRKDYGMKKLFRGTNQRMLLLLMIVCALGSTLALAACAGPSEGNSATGEATSESSEAAVESGEATSDESASEAAASTTSEAAYITRDDWADDVKAALNTLIADYGKDSANYDDTTYVVSDFDNTCCIFDIEEQLAAYQPQAMAFAFGPDEIGDVLAAGLGDLNEPREGFTMDGKAHSYQEWIDDISAAYSYLYKTYGPFTPAGMDEEAQKKIQEDEQWLEFAAKIRAMYALIRDNSSPLADQVRAPFWMKGMTEDEIYQMAHKAYEKYSKVETSEVTWTSPASVSSKVGQVEFTWTSGVQVTDNVVELYKTMQDNGIKVWICSASPIDPVRAAVDVWGLHDCVTGVLAMTNKLNDKGQYEMEYDYENGFAAYTEANGEWSKGDVATGAQPKGAGKVTAVNNVLASQYGHGPLAGFMDSTGDYDFCSVYDSLKLVVCYNRATRKVTDGGGVISELAIYQRDSLGYDLQKASAAGDTFYVLQGRDENGLRTLRNGNTTLRYGSLEEKLFANEDNEKQLQYMVDQKMTTADILDTFAKKTSADDPDNKLGFAYGFTDKYAGYHSVTDKSLAADAATAQKELKDAA